MLLILAAFLLVLWLAGTLTSFVVGGFIHILLAVALVLVVVHFFSGRRTI
ncbi:MAG: hypothetical protein JWP91_581 [Fibrobacteres bacterium]|nr:hypothetical protein [Fibrobacterota bacterium]